MHFQGRTIVPITGLLMLMISIGMMFIHNIVYSRISILLYQQHIAHQLRVATTELKTLDSIEDAISRTCSSH